MKKEPSGPIKEPGLYAVPGLIFAAASAVSAIFLMAVWGSLTPGIARFSLAFGLAAGIFSLLRILRRSPGILTASERASTALLAVFVFLCARYAGRLYFYEDGWLHVLQRARDSVLLFLSAAASLSRGGLFPPASPFLAGHAPGEPAAVLFGALSGASGFPLSSFLTLACAAAAIMLAAALYGWGRKTALCIFLFWGGAGAIQVFLARYFPRLGRELTYESIQYAALPYLEVLSSPALFFAVPAGLVLLTQWRSRSAGSERFISSRLEAFLWASLILFHPPSFVLLSVFGLAWTLFSARRSEGIRTAACAFLVAAALAIPFYGGWARLAPWLKIYRHDLWEYQPFVLFFIKAFAVTGPALAALALLSLRPRFSGARGSAIPAFLAWVFFLFFQIGPSRNGAVLVAWCYLLAAPALDIVFQSLRRPVKWFFLAVLFLPGIYLHAVRSDLLLRAEPVHSAAELESVCRDLKDIPPQERFAAALTPLHPVFLCGRPVASVFNDSLFAEGSAERKISEKVRSLMTGQPSWREQAAELGTRYVFWGRDEEEHFRGVSPEWKDAATPAVEGPWGKVFDFGDRDVLEKLRPGRGGLEVSVYADERKIPLMKMDRAVPRFEWGDSASGFLRPPWTAVFEGEIFIPEKGEVLFFLASDDGSELYIGGEKVIDNGGPHTLRVKSGRKKFESENWYPVKVIFHEEGGAAVLRLWWTLPSGKEEKVPPRYLRRAGSGGESA